MDVHLDLSTPATHTNTIGFPMNATLLFLVLGLMGDAPNIKGEAPNTIRGATPLIRGATDIRGGAAPLIEKSPNIRGEFSLHGEELPVPQLSGQR